MIMPSVRCARFRRIPSEFMDYFRSRMPFSAIIEISIMERRGAQTLDFCFLRCYINQETIVRSFSIFQFSQQGDRLIYDLISEMEDEAYAIINRRKKSVLSGDKLER